MKIAIPGSGDLELNTIVLDLNGTLTIGGEIVSGVRVRLAKLKALGYRIIFFQGDTRGNGYQIAKDLGVEFIKARSELDKETEIKKLNPENCVVIGNGLSDMKKMKVAKLGIITLQAEGILTRTLLASDIVVPSINDALDLLLDKDRLIATLRS